jgi:hypothetical protein
MTEFVITEKIQNLIDYYKRFSSTILSVTAGPPSSDLIFPDTLINPVMFTFSIYNDNINQTADVQVVVSEQLYNLGVVDYGGADIEFLKRAMTYNVPHADTGVDNGCVLCPDKLSLWLDPDTHRFYPMMGIDPNPVDQTTVDPRLQTLLGLIKQIPNVTEVVLYEYVDPKQLEKMQTDFSYRCSCYFGESTGIDGYKNVSVGIPKNVYENEIFYQSTIDNIKSLLEEAIQRQGL